MYAGTPVVLYEYISRPFKWFSHRQNAIWRKNMRRLNISDILIIKYCVIVGIGVRLVNGTTYNEGRIEIYHANEWGSICDNNFDKGDGQVVCRMLGLDTTYVLFL